MATWNARADGNCENAKTAKTSKKKKPTLVEFMDLYICDVEKKGFNLNKACL